MDPIAVAQRRLLVTYALDPTSRSELETALPEWEIRYASRTPSPELLQWAEVVFGNVQPGAALLDAPRLKWLHSPSAGMDQYDSIRTRIGAQITNVVGIGDDSVAEHGVMLILMALRCQPAVARAQLARSWIQSEVFADPPRLLTGAAVHVLGYGQIARCLLSKLDALGAITTAYRRTVEGSEPHANVRSIASVADYVGDADVLVSLLPGGAGTDRLVGEEMFSRMRAGSVFVNLGRGSAVDELALEQAVTSGHLRVAALDVFTIEPLPAESPLWTCDRTIVTPHMAGRFEGDTARQCDGFLRLVRGYVRLAPEAV